MKYLLVITLSMLMMACSQGEDQFYSFQESVGSEVILEDLENAQYFVYQKGYSCVLSNGKVVSSYKDSIYFKGDQVCRTGDMCSHSVKCENKDSLADFSLRDGNFEVAAFGNVYVYGADLSEFDGQPNKDAERTIASVDRDPNAVPDPARKNIIIIYALWIMAIAMTLYMHAPE